MTPKQKSEHVNKINETLESHGFVANTYGIYHKDNYKIDTRKNNLKIYIDGYKVSSKAIVNVSLNGIQLWLTVHGL